MLYADMLAMSGRRPGIHFVPTVHGQPASALGAIREILRS